MKNLVKGSLLLTMLSLMLVAPMAYATPSTPISGTVVITGFTQTSIHFADGNTIITATDAGLNTGDFTGTFVGTETIITHADGSGNFHGSGTFTGSLFGGPTGTCLFSFSGTFASNGVDEGRNTDNHGTGGLAGVHAEFTFHTPSVNAPYDVYSGQAHFD